jgi:hypothetical protein
MARLTKALAIPTIAAVLVLRGADSAQACSCTGDASIVKGLRDADAVFQGVIVSVAPAEPSWRHGPRRAWCWLKESIGGEAYELCIPPEMEGFVATFAVQRVWKGKVRDAARVHSFAPVGGSCGVAWQPGDQWLVAGYAIDPKLFTASACSSGLSSAADVERLDAAAKAR